SVAAPRGAQLVSVALLDARGRTLIEWPVKFDIQARGPQRRIVTGRSPGGRFALVRARFSLPALGKPAERLSRGRPGERARRALPDCLVAAGEEGRLLSGDAGGTVRCDLRAAVIAGGAPRAAATVRMTLSDGSMRAGRLFDSPLGRGFLAVPPSRLG